MDDRDRQEEEQKTKVEIEKTKVEIKKSWVVIVMIIIGGVIYVANAVDEHKLKKEEKKIAQQQLEIQQQQQELEQQEREKKKSPLMEISTGQMVYRGNEKYQVIRMSNVNADAVIKSGTLTVCYRVRGQGESTSIDCYLHRVVYEETVSYIERQREYIFFLRKDYHKFSETIETYLEDQGIDVQDGMKFQPYLLIYYKYTCGEENLDGYYKIDIMEHGFGAVEEIDEPEEYINVYMIEI